jgi:hypothetical protein
MSSTAITIEEALGNQTEWTELASRGNDGLEVALLWNQATDRVKVTVADSKLDDAFELHVPGAEALEAFNHPFAYAANRGFGFGDAFSESHDLQLQD